MYTLDAGLQLIKASAIKSLSGQDPSKGAGHGVVIVPMPMPMPKPMPNDQRILAVIMYSVGRSISMAGALVRASRV